jgi:hypothetical protein
VALDLSSLFRFAPGRRRAAAGGTAVTPTQRPSQSATILPVPDYRDHLLDVFEDRLNAVDARTVLQNLFRNDPDVSAAVNAYLTLADTEPMVFIKGVDGQFDREAYKTFGALLQLFAHQADMTLGYQNRPGLPRICEGIRHMLLLRGACGAELVMDKGLVPTEFRLVDPVSIRWYERKPGERKPVQVISGQTGETSLDIPTFFYTDFRGSPVSAYPVPPFISAINTITSRQRVINDLYRIMAATGYPRLDVKVLEEVLTKNAPPTVRNTARELTEWVNARIAEVRASFSAIRPEESFVHTDSVEVSILNERNPAAGLNVESIIGVLNAQNQAGLKSVSTILGRGESGVNTASVESRIFALNADALNAPVAHILSRAFTVALQLAGHPVFCELRFRKAELRPLTELEPQLVMRQSRLLQALSYGLITDEEAHIELFGRIPPEGVPELMGTRFFVGTQEVGQADQVSPNSDPQGRSLAPEGGASARSNNVRRGGQ